MPEQYPNIDFTEVEYFASLLLTDQELDDWLELNRGSVTRALDREGDPLGKAVRTGRLKTKCEVRESLITAARRHSTPAQQMVNNMIDRLDIQ